MVEIAENQTIKIAPDSIEIPTRSTNSISTVSSLDLSEKAGWLQKKSNRLLKRWQRRYFVLKDRRLSYYNKPDDESPKLSINFDQVTVDLNIDDPDKPNEITLNLFGDSRTFRIRATSHEENKSWALALIHHIEASEGFKRSKLVVKPPKNYFKTPRISDSQFRVDVRTGDLLLFKSKSLAAKINRGLTRSQYDHAALLLKWGSGTIELMYMTSLEEVRIMI